MQIHGEVPEGSGEGFRCRYMVRFRRVPVQIAGEVPEGSGADTSCGSEGFRCRCFVKFQRVPMFFNGGISTQFSNSKT